MNEMKITYTSTPVFNTTKIDSVLPENKDLRINPKYSYSPLNESSYLLGLNFSLQIFDYSSLNKFEIITETEYEINVSNPNLKDKTSNDFFKLFCFAYLEQINNAIEQLNNKVEKKITKYKLEDITKPAILLLGVSHQN